MEETRNDIYHTPVLLEEVLTWLAPDAVPDNTAGAGVPCVVVDATAGEGGHSEAFLSRFPQTKLYCVDADSRQIREAEKRLSGFGNRARFFNCLFSGFFENYDSQGLSNPDRILMDLGISMYHFKGSERGFSFAADEPLDMRISDTLTKTAADIVNREREEEIARILFEYGEERASRKIARAIVLARKQAPLKTTKELAGLVARVLGKGQGHAPRSRIHPATKTFQALRIAVNRELEELEQGLAAGFSVLKPSGKIGVITFHSLEDRIVKRFFQAKQRGCTCDPETPMCQCGGKKECTILTKKPVTASDEEIRKNPASRSAKLRVAEKCL
ncbi:MAG: 16S rRNA (cytosine(1402)-N(4))-methyltransferase RsmH [Spirochaetaceae bacterium]|nr:MAG: 16S rRNA (cytosine(1402)-N(4))-methyltransferase RsmH [Spirochaetaceae bacterium]